MTTSLLSDGMEVALNIECLFNEKSNYPHSLDLHS